MFFLKRLTATFKKAAKILARTIDSTDASALPFAAATHRPLALTL